MTRIRLSLLILPLALVGCVDNVDSVSREYRNANNEAVDAMMMITDDTRAAQMTRRIFKRMKDRYDALDRKVEIIKDNRDKKDFVKEVYESDSLHIYLTELEVNRERYQLEIMRLKDLVKQLGGDRENCPNLYDLCYKDDVLSTLRKQLTDAKLAKYIDQFPSWKVGDLPGLYAKFEAKRKVFGSKRMIVLVN
jgi:hypothetical protein